jgi:hypothetical protein
MNEFITTLTQSGSLIGYLSIDMAVAILLLGCIRYTMAMVSKVDTVEELAKKDNFAYGISVAGGVAAMGIALSGTITGELAGSYQIELLGMLVYGLAALMLIKAGSYIHDKYALPDFDKRDLILNRNLAVAIVDAASAIATATVVRAAIMWVDGISVKTFIALAAAWIVSQVMLVIITRLFEWKYSKNNGISFQTALTNNHIALAIRYSGYLISTSMSVTAASYFILFDMDFLWIGVSQWVMFSIILMLVLTALTAIAKFLVLWGINRREEVEDQQNIGIAIIELATSFAIALLLMALMS